nr:MAG TPA: hypothetical protein [Caudoviricetes sp.]
MWSQYHHNSAYAHKVFLVSIFFCYFLSTFVDFQQIADTANS